jgi:hypothetical protein
VMLAFLPVSQHSLNWVSPEHLPPPLQTLEQGFENTVRPIWSTLTVTPKKRACVKSYKWLP